MRAGSVFALMCVISLVGTQAFTAEEEVKQFFRRNEDLIEMVVSRAPRNVRRGYTFLITISFSNKSSAPLPLNLICGTEPFIVGLTISTPLVHFTPPDIACDKSSPHTLSIPPTGQRVSVTREAKILNDAPLGSLSFHVEVKHNVLPLTSNDIEVTVTD